MKDLIKRLRDQQTKFMTPILGQAADALERMQWNPDMEAARGKGDILVMYDHEAASYHTDETQTRLSDYACHAESGDFMDGTGVCIARWCEGYVDGNEMEGEPEGWMPASWFAKGSDGDYSYAVFPIEWMHLPPE